MKELLPTSPAARCNVLVLRPTSHIITSRTIGVIAVATSVALAGCGGDSQTQTTVGATTAAANPLAIKIAKPVELERRSRATVRDNRQVLRGTVRPAGPNTTLVANIDSEADRVELSPNGSFKLKVDTKKIGKRYRVTLLATRPGGDEAKRKFTFVRHESKLERELREERQRREEAEKRAAEAERSKTVACGSQEDALLYSITGTGVDCSTAHTVASQWSSECASSEAGVARCTVSAGFQCTFTETGHEAGVINCSGAKGSVRFETGL